MPTYDFRCPNGHEFTRFYKTMSTSQSEVPCPECNAVAQRQMSAGAGLVFKGSGFYLTDYGKNAHRGGSRPSSSAATGDKKESAGEAKSSPDSSGEKAGSREPKAESREPKTESPKPKAESREPKAASPKPKAE